MPTSTRYPALFYRSLLGCGFLLFGWAHPAWAQREVELHLSGGVSLAQLAISRQHLSNNFIVPGGFNTAATLRLTVPVSQRIGLGLEQRVTGLGYQFAYKLPESQQTTGLSYNTVHQTGMSVRMYDIWAPGPHWGLDLAATGSYGWGSATNSVPYEGTLFGGSMVPGPATRAEPQISIKETSKTGTAMVGLEALLRYEWGLRNSLLLTAGYHYGLREVMQVHSTRLEYVDEAGIAQQGSFRLSSRGSYGTVQLGYGLRLGTLATTRNKHLTPRYSIDEAEDANDDSPIN